MALYWDPGSYQMLDDGKSEAAPAAPAIDPNQDFLNRFAYKQGGAAGTGELNQYLTGLIGQGYGASDFESAFKKYLESQGLPVGDYTEAGYGYNKYNDQRHSAWWGEQDRIKAIGSGLDLMGKDTGWKNIYNPTLAQQQGQKVGEIGTQQQNNGPSDMDDLMDVLKFAGAAGGLYGLGGFLGGAGAAGGATGAAAGGATGGMSLAPSAFEGIASALVPAGANVVPAGLTAVGGGAAIPASSGFLGALAGAGAAAGGVGSPSIGTDVVASGSGGGSSGGNMGDWDFMDLLNGDTPVEWPTGTNPYGGDLGLPSGTLPDGSVDVGASWQNQLQAALSGMPNLPPGLSSAIKALSGGSGSSGLLGLLGKGIGGVLDYSASSKAADNAKEIADRTWGAGTQYRNNASAAMTPGFDLNSIPGYSGALSTGMDAFNRSLSAKNGNPWGQGGAAGEAISWAGKTIGLPAWQNYFNSNSNAGGLSNLATQSTTAGLNAGAADAATYGSLGQTARNIFDPQPDYQRQYLDLLGKQYGLS